MRRIHSLWLRRSQHLETCNRILKFWLVYLPMCPRCVCLLQHKGSMPGFLEGPCASLRPFRGFGTDSTQQAGLDQALVAIQSSFSQHQVCLQAPGFLFLTYYCVYPVAIQPSVRLVIQLANRIRVSVLIHYP